MCGFFAVFYKNLKKSNNFEKLIYFNEAPIDRLMNATLAKLFFVAKQNNFKVI
tara:strand:+ start:208 stop:366 length:159 start_codon:yes stop_codon:yes gene_type:complete